MDQPSAQPVTQETTSETQQAGSGMGQAPSLNPPRIQKKFIIIAVIALLPVFTMAAFAPMIMKSLEPPKPKVTVQSIKYPNQKGEILTDGKKDPFSFVELAPGDTVTLDLGKPQEMSNVTLYQNLKKPGTITGNVKICSGSKTSLSDCKTVFSGNIKSSALGESINFPKTTGQYVQITAGTNSSGSTQLSEIQVSNPQTSPTPTPPNADNPTLTPTPTSWLAYSVTPIPTIDPLNPPSPTPTIDPLNPPTPTPTHDPFTPPQPTVGPVIPSNTPNLGPSPTPTPISLNVMVTTNGIQPANLQNLVNGVVSLNDYAQVEAGAYMQINLPESKTINKILVYPQPVQNRIVQKLKVEISNGSGFSGASTLFYGDVLATVNGVIIMPNPPILARYIRITGQGVMNGNVEELTNYFSEVLIWGQ